VDSGPVVDVSPARVEFPRSGDGDSSRPSAGANASSSSSRPQAPAQPPVSPGQSSGGTSYPPQALRVAVPVTSPRPGGGPSTSGSTSTSMIVSPDSITPAATTPGGSHYMHSGLSGFDPSGDLRSIPESESPEGNCCTSLFCCHRKPRQQQ
jgi:hypothetical protein